MHGSQVLWWCATVVQRGKAFTRGVGGAGAGEESGWGWVKGTSVARELALSLEEGTFAEEERQCCQTWLSVGSRRRMDNGKGVGKMMYKL
ncbi:hypothetical protein L2E82_15423 [Cichorium intybus]|uniref:Uncharacterized protein n=1 Tax=Cichorium intybus TaxID=13427 RepID=A0ACB9F2S0_CICIN|nr:hypothetical protein L2E82_15423 [Cichorium intybus]